MYGNYNETYPIYKQDSQTIKNDQKEMYGNYNNVYPNVNNKKSSNCPSINEENMFQNYLNEYQIVIVKAWASWCVPCEIFSKKIDELVIQLNTYINNKYIVFLSDNIDDSNSIHHDKVDVVPTFFVYIHGNLDNVFTGVDYDLLIKYIYKMLSSIK